MMLARTCRRAKARYQPPFYIQREEASGRRVLIIIIYDFAMASLLAARTFGPCNAHQDDARIDDDDISGQGFSGAMMMPPLKAAAFLK